MFSGLGNQISGFVSSKMGKGEAPPEGGEPPAQQEMMIDENGQEVPVQPAAGGGAMGFAQGLMAKAAAAKDGMAQKAGALGGLQVNILTLIFVFDRWGECLGQWDHVNLLDGKTSYLMIY